MMGDTSSPTAAVAAVAENMTAKFCANDPRCRSARTYPLKWPRTRVSTYSW